MMKQQHVLNQIPDYVLGLLPRNERQQVEQHTVVCTACNRALQSESKLGQLVHSTLVAATRPPTNLRQFMPAIPQRRVFLFADLFWQKRLAPLALFLLLLLGSLGFYLSEQRAIWTNPSPASLAVTATMTDEPTAALTQTRSEQAILPRRTTVRPETLIYPETTALVKTAVATAPSQPQIAATPAPNPTPIAALPLKMTSN